MVKKTFIFFIKLYQKLISPFFPPTCRFYPSCSEYAILAIEERGPVMGLFLALMRILRCHPLSKGGIDLVPKSKKY